MSRLPTSHPLHGCQLKLDRAYDHVESLDRAIQWFLRRHPHEPVPELRVEAREYVAYMKVREDPPLWWSTVVGDAIHNMRSALDHAVYQLAVANGQTPSGTAYPVLTDDPNTPETDKRTRGVWKKLAKQIHPDDLAFIERTQPYKGRHLGDRHNLLLTNRLSNWDKHNTLHLAASVLTHSLIGFEAIEDVELGAVEAGYSGAFENGTVVAVCPCRYTGDYPQVKVTGQLRYGVAFGEGGPPGTEDVEVVQVLTRLTNHSHDIILDLADSPRFDQGNS